MLAVAGAAATACEAQRKVVVTVMRHRTKAVVLSRGPIKIW
jgi:hypothetical protein